MRVLAYHDSFSGVLPCIVLAMRDNDRETGMFRRELLVRYTTERGGYSRCEEEWWPASAIIPRQHFHRSSRGPSWYYTTPYSWEELLSDA